jgi:hypothetical protein
MTFVGRSTLPDFFDLGHGDRSAGRSDIRQVGDDGRSLLGCQRGLIASTESKSSSAKK